MSDEAVFEVSHIVDEDCSDPNKRVFKVHWVGYPSEYDSWEPVENLADGASRVIREWDRKKKQQQKLLAKRKVKEADVISGQRRRERQASQSEPLFRSAEAHIHRPDSVRSATPSVKVIAFFDEECMCLIAGEERN